jgi:hypothetical protein
MRSEEKKVIEFSPRGDDYDAFMIDFLDREASTQGNSSVQQGGDEDELDSMVSDFLREAATLEVKPMQRLKIVCPILQPRPA